MKKNKLYYLFIFFLILVNFSLAQDRFPKPEFDSGHIVPKPTTPEARSLLLQYLDVLVLFISLSLSSYFALKKRSRRATALLSFFCLGYFGFYRAGCVCSIGAIQNIALAFFNSSYSVPTVVVLFFSLPLLFTLFFGRTFCASVCPLGAIQDIFIIKPIQISAWILTVLSIIPYIYLCLSLLFAITGSGFIICRYDPFVAFFRLNGSFKLVILGVYFLITGIFVARPYCRFFCPYGVLLGWMSYFSKSHVTITPDTCINCKLCEDACPFGAIIPPTSENIESRSKGVRRLIILFILLPFTVIAGGFATSKLNKFLSKMHPVIQLVTEVKNSEVKNSERNKQKISDELKAFKQSGKSIRELSQEAINIRKDFALYGWFFGSFLSFVLMMKILSLSIFRKNKEYTTNKVDCFSCARCFSFCPKERAKKSQNELSS